MSESHGDRDELSSDDDGNRRIYVSEAQQRRISGRGRMTGIQIRVVGRVREARASDQRDEQVARQTTGRTERSVHTFAGEAFGPLLEIELC